MHWLPQGAATPVKFHRATWCQLRFAAVNLKMAPHSGDFPSCLQKYFSFSQIMCWLLTSFQPRNNNQSHPWPPGPLPVGAANHAGSTTLGDKEPTASKEGWAASWRHSRRTCGRSGWREKLELGYQKGLESLQVVYWILLNCNVSGGYEFSKRAFAKIASLYW